MDSSKASPVWVLRRLSRGYRKLSGRYSIQQSGRTTTSTETEQWAWLPLVKPCRATADRSGDRTVL